MSSRIERGLNTAGRPPQNPRCYRLEILHNDDVIFRYLFLLSECSFTKYASPVTVFEIRFRKILICLFFLVVFDEACLYKCEKSKYLILVT